jgi:hypothetical protein
VVRNERSFERYSIFFEWMSRFYCNTPFCSPLTLRRNLNKFQFSSKECNINWWCQVIESRTYLIAIFSDIIMYIIRLIHTGIGIRHWRFVKDLTWFKTCLSFIIIRDACEHGYIKTIYIHTYIPLMLYPRRGSRGISDIPPRRPRFNQSYLPMSNCRCDRL